MSCLVIAFSCEQVESAAVRNRSPSLRRQTLFWASKRMQVIYSAAGGESSPNVTQWWFTKVDSSSHITKVKSE
jgi:hypothetical protein